MLQLVGRKLWLEYFDHNESFAKVLPQGGTVEHCLSSKAGDGWVLFRLDAPVEYEGRSYEYFLLTSRWRGFEIGDSKPTSVFILLVDDIGTTIDFLMDQVLSR